MKNSECLEYLIVSNKLNKETTEFMLSTKVDNSNIDLHYFITKYGFKFKDSFNEFILMIGRHINRNITKENWMYLDKLLESYLSIFVDSDYYYRFLDLLSRYYFKNDWDNRFRIWFDRGRYGSLLKINGKTYIACQEDGGLLLKSIDDAKTYRNIACIEKDFDSDDIKLYSESEYTYINKLSKTNKKRKFMVVYL